VIALVHSKEVCPLPNPPPLPREREQLPRFIGMTQTLIASVPSPASEAMRGRDREGVKALHSTTPSIAAKRYAFFTTTLERFRP
jgi:hypothetical protein